MHRAGRRRAARGRRARSRPARPTAPTTPSCCCGSWPRWPSRRCSSSRAYVRSLSREELNALWLDYREVGRRFGLREREMPRGHRRLRAPTWPDMYASGDLFVTRRRARAGDRHRPEAAGARAVRGRCVELVNQITVGLLPGGLRRQYGFRWDPLRGARAARRRGVRPAAARLLAPRRAGRAGRLDCVGDEVRDHDEDHALEHERLEHGDVAGTLIGAADRRNIPGRRSRTRSRRR